MYQFIQQISKLDLLRRQIPAASSSFVIASLFYKFGSFALECVAFLATWYLIDFVVGAVFARVGVTRSPRPT